MSHDQSPLLREVVIQVRDDLHCYICFTCAWGTHNLQKRFQKKHVFFPLRPEKLDSALIVCIEVFRELVVQKKIPKIVRSCITIMQRFLV